MLTFCLYFTFCLSKDTNKKKAPTQKRQTSVIIRRDQKNKATKIIRQISVNIIQNQINKRQNINILCSLMARFEVKV